MIHVDTVGAVGYLIGSWPRGQYHRRWVHASSLRTKNQPTMQWDLVGFRLGLEVLGSWFQTTSLGAPVHMTREQQWC